MPPTIRRHDFSPRLEVLPLLDVVFLLLTFFIYAMIVLIQADALRMTYAPVTGGEATEAGEHRTVTLTLSGQVELDGKPHTMDALEQAFTQIAAMDPQPTVYVLSQDEVDRRPGQAVVDRLPLFQQVIGLANRTKVKECIAVGPAHASTVGGGGE